MNRAAILLLFLLGGFGSLRSQSVGTNHEIFGTQNGLPHNVVLSTYQDSEGFLWVGTYNGLCRYDGSEFKVYRDEFDPTGLGWVYAVEFISEDRAGNIWIGTRGGLLACLDKRKNTWTRYKDNLHNDLGVTSFSQDNEGDIWVGKRNGWIGKVDTTSKTVSYKQAVKGDIFSISAYDNNHLLVNTNNLYLFNKKNGSSSFFKGVLYKREFYGRNPLVYNNSLVTKLGDSILICTRQGIRVSAFQTPALFKRPLASRIFMGDPQKENFYLCNERYILEYGRQGRLINTLQVTDSRWLSEPAILNCLTVDRNGIIWIGTNNGLHKIDPDKHLFRKYLTGSREESVPYNYVRAVHLQGNKLWIGFREGNLVSMKLPENGSEPQIQTYPCPFPGNGNGYVTINAITTDKKGNIWAGGVVGLYRMQPGEKLFREVKLKDSTGRYFTLMEIWDIYEDRMGRIWAGTIRGGLYVIDPRSGEYTNYKNRLTGENSYYAAWKIYEDNRGNIYLGTNNGVEQVKILPSGQLKITLFRHSLLEGCHVWNIIEDRKHNLWLGTTNKGLYRFNPDLDLEKHYTMKEGLPNNAVCGLLVDNKNNLWIGTMNGLSQLNPDNGQISNYTEEDGLISNDFNFKACALAQNGEMFWGTKVGLVSFKPEMIKHSGPFDANVVITAFDVLDEKPDTGSLHGIEADLSHKQNYFSFSFALLDFSKPNKHIFRYRLQGYDRQWNYTKGSSRVAMYNNVPPGAYRMVVEGSPDGVNWSTRHAEMLIRIQPAYWQRTWFWVIVIVTFLLVVSLIVYKRIASLLNREREKAMITKKLAALEMKALQAQMNPHFIFNSINAIQHYIIRKDVVTANDYLTKFARLMRFFLESSKERYVQLEDELQMMELYLSIEKLRFGSKFDYRVTVSGEVDAYEIQIPSMILQPFIENAVNHGLAYLSSGGMLDLSFTMEPGNQLHCIIDDNGVGRAKAAEMKNVLNKKHKSRAMELVDERLKSLETLEERPVSFQITDKLTAEGLAAGTRVDIYIPINPN